MTWRHCAEALITIDNLDPDALTQLHGLLNADSTDVSKVAMMSGRHPVKDYFVGFTQRLDEAEVADRIIPLYNFKG